MTIHVSTKSADYWACDTLGEIKWDFSYDNSPRLSHIPIMTTLYTILLNNRLRDPIILYLYVNYPCTLIIDSVRL